MTADTRYMLDEIIKAIERVENEGRGTGRTTRMMEHAIAQARGGQAVLVLVHDPSLAFVLRRKVPLGLHGRVTVKSTGSDLCGQAYDLMLEDHHSQFLRALEAVRTLPRADNRRRVPGEGLDDAFEIEPPAPSPATSSRPRSSW